MRAFSEDDSIMRCVVEDVVDNIIDNHEFGDFKKVFKTQDPDPKEVTYMYGENELFCIAHDEDNSHICENLAAFHVRDDDFTYIYKRDCAKWFK
jgi:hypothetical protein